MHIQGLLQLICEELSLLLLFEVFLFEHKYLPSEVRYAGGLVLSDNEFALEVGDLLLGADDLSDLLLIVDLALVQGRLLDLYLLIQYLQLLITLDQLRTQDVSLVYHHLVVLLLFLFFLLGLGDDEFETGDVTFLSFDHVIAGGYLFLDLVDVSIERRILLLVLLLLICLTGDGIILALNLLFELRDLLSHPLELHLELSDLLRSLE